MDYKALTAQALAENRPDLVAEFKAAGVASVEKIDAEAIRAEATTAERARIAAIEALSMPGAEAVIAAAKADGASADVTAVKVIQHVRAAGASKGASALANIKAAETDMDPPKAAATDDKLTDEQQAVANMDALRAAGVIR